MDMTGVLISALAGGAAAVLRKEPSNRKVIPDYADALIGAAGGMTLAYYLPVYYPGFTLISYICFTLLCAMSGYALDDLASSVAYLATLPGKKSARRRRR